MSDILVDTDVMIEFLKGGLKAKRFIVSNHENISVSVITVAELFSGIRNEAEKTALESTLSTLKILSLDNKIASLGGMYRKNFMKSHNVGLADALIAATATTHNYVLKTFNIKHFPMLKNVSKPYKQDN